MHVYENFFFFYRCACIGMILHTWCQVYCAALLWDWSKHIQIHALVCNGAAVKTHVGGSAGTVEQCYDLHLFLYLSSSIPTSPP